VKTAVEKADPERNADENEKNNLAVDGVNETVSDILNTLAGRDPDHENQQ